MLRFKALASLFFSKAGALRNAILLMASPGLLFSGLSTAQAQLRYLVIPVAVGSGEGINNQGDIVGTLSANDQAFLYRKGRLTDLESLRTLTFPWILIRPAPKR